jgi:hypothetical protein
MLTHPTAAVVSAACCLQGNRLSGTTATCASSQPHLLQLRLLLTFLLPPLLPPATHLSTTGIAENSHLRKSNYFYYNCITGHFLRDNCPSYLREAEFSRLHGGLINRLTIASGFFLDELRARKFTKVRAAAVTCVCYLWFVTCYIEHGGLINRLTIASGFFLDELRARKFTKVCCCSCHLCLLSLVCNLLHRAWGPHQQADHSQRLLP